MIRDLNGDSKRENLSVGTEK